MAEPDFYLRCGNSLFIIEYKDLVMSDKVKYSDDVTFIKTEILDRLCLDDGKSEKVLDKFFVRLKEFLIKTRLRK